jgi:hypothetical protein
MKCNIIVLSSITNRVGGFGDYQTTFACSYQPLHIHYSALDMQCYDSVNLENLTNQERRNHQQS